MIGIGMDVISPHSSNGPGISATRPSTRPRLIVIAASAGGLDALWRLLHQLPAHFPAAIAIVQHRGADLPERLIEILAKSTALKLCHAESGMPLEAGTVYVCPPGVHMVAEHTLRLIDGPRVNYVRPNADLMLESAAQTYGERAIGVVLSGCGSDGAVGSLSIAQAGGTVFTQDSGTCGFPGMPLATLQVGATDLSLSPEEIANALQEMLLGYVPKPASPDSSAPGYTRVLLADDHQVVVEGLHVLINGEHDMTVVGRAEGGEAAMHRAAELSPDVVVMDVCMPGVDGIVATREILSRVPSAKVVALSSRSDAATVDQILRAGATGYLTKERAFRELVLAIRSVISDKVYFSSDVARLVASGRVRAPAPRSAS